VDEGVVADAFGFFSSIPSVFQDIFQGISLRFFIYQFSQFGDIVIFDVCLA